MRWRVLIVAALVAATAAVAVGTGGSGAPDADAATAYSVPWRLHGDRRPRSREVRILWRAGGYACEWRFERATATETRRSVTIRVLAEHEPMPPGTVCAAVVAGGRAMVRLDRRLGSRRLRHAPVTMP